MENNKVFWAFSNEQLEEGKAKIGIKENSELTSMGAGGFMPKANVAKFIADMEAEDKRYKQAMKDAKEAKDEAILYELNNHEAYYTGRIDEVVEKFTGIYSKKEIFKVYIKYRNKHQCQNCGEGHSTQKQAFRCCHNETKKAEAEEEEQEREESRGR